MVFRGSGEGGGSVVAIITLLKLGIWRIDYQ